MKSVRLGLFCLSALLPALTGCGSGSSAPFSLTCTVTPLSGNLLRAAVTVTNHTSSSSAAILYGSVFINLRHFYPVVLVPQQVLVVNNKGRNSYPGFRVPHVSPNTPSHVLLRFVTPLQARSIAVTNTSTVQAGNDDPLSKSNCTIGARGTT